jgi:hypothetical protein
VRHGGHPEHEQGSQHHGLVLEQWRASPDLQAAHDMFASDAFARALLDRFSDPLSRAGRGPAIPLHKHALFAGEVREYTCVFSLYKDLEHYEISPHTDHPSKLVTFLWYLDDEWSNPCGTLLCRPKPGVDVTRLNLDYEAARQEGRTGLWMKWDSFDIVKSVSGPNLLLAFAPSESSYHAVKLPVSAPDMPRERLVLRGFIARKGYRDTRLIAD